MVKPHKVVGDERLDGISIIEYDVTKALVSGYCLLCNDVSLQFETLLYIRARSIDIGLMHYYTESVKGRSKCQ